MVKYVIYSEYRDEPLPGKRVPDYADFARALGAWGERVTEPQAIVPAIKRAVEKTKEGTPALLELITERQSPRSAEA